jgi:hypothetical protein
MKTPFNEKTMRDIKSVKDALKIYGEEKIPQKRIVWLFQETFEVRFANISVNVAYLQQLSKAEAQKFIEKLCGKNKSKVQAFEKALAIWKAKFSNVRQPIQDAPVKAEPIAETKTATATESATESDSNV